MLLALLAGVSSLCLGAGKRIVLVSGDEEYRSEQALPQLARILSARHGFDCTVLFATDPKDGTINPDQPNNIPGLEALDTADLMVIFTRFRDLPDEQMKHIVDYVESGRPIVAMRTATHAFALKSSKTYARYSWNSKEWDGGFGRQVLGETWIAHHGQHGKQSTRAIVVTAQASHPILRGIRDGDIWTPTDVYEVRLPLPEWSRLFLREILGGGTENQSRLNIVRNGFDQGAERRFKRVERRDDTVDIRDIQASGLGHLLPVFHRESSVRFLRAVHSAPARITIADMKLHRTIVTEI